MWDEVRQVEIGVCKPDVSTAGPTFVFSRGTEHVEYDTRKYINDQEGRFSFALEHVLCSNMLLGAFMWKY